MVTSNHIRVKGALPWRAYLFYVDSRAYVADRIFRKHGLRVHFIGDFEMEGLEYVVVSVWVRHQDVSKFELCMRDLEKAILVRDGTRYEDACRFVMHDTLGAC